MKQLITFCCVLAVLISLAVPAFANEQETLITQDVMEYGDGIVIIDELYEVAISRTSTKEYTRKKIIMSGGTTIGIVAIKGKFSYDGSKVSVVSKSVAQTDTYNGWNYKQNSFTSSGGTITLDAKLTKLVVANVPFTISLTCDKNGNVS